VGEFDKTCDGICHRAWVRGITRGLQVELEARADNRKPYPERTEMEEMCDCDGELQLQAEFASRMSKLFDNPQLVRI
jgi:hypothetical protein